MLDDYDHETLDNKGDTETPVNYPAHEDNMDMIESANKTGFHPVATIEDIRSTKDLDSPWSAGLLLDAIGFRTRVRGRVEEYLKTRETQSLSLRELMDLFLPPAVEAPFEDDTFFWLSIPILRQNQYGPYLHDSALLAMTEADMSQEFKAEWAMRICRMKLYELRDRPTNKRFQQTPKKRRGR